MRKTLEKNVESYLKRKLFDLGIDCVKFVPDQAPGMPDRLALLPGGRVLWVELKTDGGRLSDLQLYRHHWLARLGHDVRVIWSKEQVDDLVRELIDERIAAVK